MSGKRHHTQKQNNNRNYEIIKLWVVYIWRAVNKLAVKAIIMAHRLCSAKWSCLY